MRLAAPNYTQTPNALYDQVFKTLTDGELRVILVLVRQTFGWHKQFDRISLNQMAEKTGFLRTSVCRILNSLIAKGLVEKKKFGPPGKERCYFGLVVETPPKEPIEEDDGCLTEEEMQILSNNSYQSPYGDPPSLPRETGPVSLGRLPSLPEETSSQGAHTYRKETLSKETTAKERSAPPPAAAVFVLHESTKPGPTSSEGIYPPLQGIEIPDEEKRSITRAFKPAQIDHALKWLSNTDQPIRCAAAAIKWAAKALPELAPPKMSMLEVIQQHFKHGEVYNGATCYLTADYLCFERGLRNEDVKLAKGFSWGKVKSLCESFGIHYPFEAK